MPTKTTLIPSLWDVNAKEVRSGDPLSLLRYRSNILGADLRITNFGGGNTSSKYETVDPKSGRTVRVMAVKGSGGDLGSIKESGFAILYLDELEALKNIYRGEAHEDEMVAFYPSCAFAGNTVPASIDTPLHAFIPYPHVDHLHPDWAIALAASANGKEKLAEFNARYGRNLVWLAWQRPGFELALMLEKAAKQEGVDGVVLGSHGLFTWGNTQQECYENSLAILNELGEFITEHEAKVAGKAFGGARYRTRADAAELAVRIAPYLRGALATTRRSIGHFTGTAEVLEFVNSNWAPRLAALGTSCPDHFIRTRIAPLYVDWNPETGTEKELEAAIEEGLVAYTERYTQYYESNKEPGSPALRDPNPSVVLIPGVGMFSYGRNKKEARITGEFYVNAIHVMAGATALEDANSEQAVVPQARFPERSNEFARFHNYVALPPREAFRIEYWALEEAKLQRMPAEKEFARRIFLIVGGGSGIGRAVAHKLAGLEAHLMIADRNEESARAVEATCAGTGGKEAVAACYADLTVRESLRLAVEATVKQFGGIDGVINTAALTLGPLKPGQLPEDQWRTMLEVNLTSNFVLADVVKPVLLKQDLTASIVLTSSANAVVAKSGSESYDISKAGLNHLIRELAVGFAPLVRVNGVAPATVVEGSEMFPHDRVVFSLRKYGLPAEDHESTEVLRERLAAFYASRTLTKLAVRPQDCAEAILWLASERSSRTTGHVIPVDGGLVDAFLR
jgi:rhamnose utilization protein RhaD (predicted bifunctional aldolase and dehydrogenase)/NAD(P)-dependent dehydrogenase (short-subunit alcohol dehydrogenase family)